MTDRDLASIVPTLHKITSGVSLTRSEAGAVLRLVMSGVIPEIQTAALLTALRTKGESIEEITGFADAMREHALPVTLADDPRPVIDTCGTGGDGHNTFNVSTTVALVAAGAGIRVAKHGNRAASSETGSADLLEALGVAVLLGPEAVARSIAETCFGFMFAPAYHPAMKHVMPVRRGLGFPTVFNILGPISNPAGVRRQVLGVRDIAIGRTLAQVLAQLGAERVLAVSSSEGADELTLGGPNHVVDYGRERDSIEEYQLSPSELGLPLRALSQIRGGSAEDNANLTQSVLDGEPGPYRETVLLNAAAALIASGLASDWMHGLELSRTSIDSGSAGDVLRRTVALSNQLASEAVA